MLINSGNEEIRLSRRSENVAFCVLQHVNIIKSQVFQSYHSMSRALNNAVSLKMRVTIVTHGKYNVTHEKYLQNNEYFEKKQ